MGDCIYCGKPAGIFKSRHIECTERSLLLEGLKSSDPSVKNGSVQNLIRLGGHLDAMGDKNILDTLLFSLSDNKNLQQVAIRALETLSKNDSITDDIINILKIIEEGIKLRNSDISIVNCSELEIDCTINESFGICNDCDLLIRLGNASKYSDYEDCSWEHKYSCPVCGNLLEGNNIVLHYFSGSAYGFSVRTMDKIYKLSKLFNAIEENNINKIKRFFDSKYLCQPPDVNEKFVIYPKAQMDDKGETALSFALTEGINVEIIKLLVKNNADVNQKTGFGITPLMRAILIKNPEIVEVLLDAGADVNAISRKIFSSGIHNDKNMENKTALMVAIDLEQDKIVELLLEKKPNFRLKNSGNKTAWIKAMEKNNEKIINLLISAGAHVE